MAEISNICGVQPEGFVKIDISSDPNFVFEKSSFLMTSTTAITL